MQFQCYAHYYSILMRTITRHTIHVGALENYTKSSNNNNNFKFIKHLFHAGFSIEGGTRRLIAAYFGIYSRLLCV